MKTLNDLLSLAKNIGKFSSGYDYMEVEKYTDNILRFYLYTDQNRYCIHAVIEDDRTYLGCGASSRKPRAGETWTRGNDLADGKLNRKTWNKILGDIISYELVRVHKLEKPTPDIDDVCDVTCINEN